MNARTLELWQRAEQNLLSDAEVEELGRRLAREERFYSAWEAIAGIVGIVLFLLVVGGIVGSVGGEWGAY